MRRTMLLVVAGLLAAAAPAFAQTGYPSRPIEVVVPFAPGGDPVAALAAVAVPVTRALRTAIIRR